IGTINIKAVQGSTIFTGDYIGTGSGVINIEFSSAGVDELKVDGQVTFGALAEIFLNGYAPTSGNYTVVTYGGGHIGQVFPGALDAEGWQVGNTWYYFIPNYMPAGDTALILGVQTGNVFSQTITNYSPVSGTSGGGTM